ncbi:hypothetical protein [Nocardia sp. NPDC052566]|uniref:hypothetical protein n=1 Tax=Nocardia sp. NPDC052566 TaxID=3364330 RepID=UPI0037C63F4A
MRSTTATLLVLGTVLAGPWGTAAAQPPAAPPPPPPATALLTLTTMPNGWQSRTDLRAQLEVFADGRAVKVPDATAPTRDPNTPPQRIGGHIPTDVLAASVAETKSLAAVDLGTPGATDQGSQIIDLLPQQPDQDVHVVMYAPDATEGLSAEQQAARKRFADLFRKLLDSFVKD